MNSYGNFNLVGIADFSVGVADALEQIIASMNLNLIPDMLYLTMIYLAQQLPELAGAVVEVAAIVSAV
ncbi:MAG: hypothetical protein EZS28_011579, partial [Streblomastix strix]